MKATTKSLPPRRAGAPRRDHPAERLYWSGEPAPAGTYVSLDEGKLVHVPLDGALPRPNPHRRCYMLLSDAPDYTAPLSLSLDAA